MEEKRTYIGLDIGTDSVGWAVTDENYRLKKYHGNLMWGIHLFDEASQAAERRAFRTARRRLDRRQQRIKLLQELLAPAVLEKDPDFFLRLKESALLPEDFQTRTHDLYFQDADYDDSAYHKDYPTIHHLICDLMNNPAPHDVRLVYIACAYLLAHRGHFLREIDPEKVDELLDFSELYQRLLIQLGDYNIGQIFPDEASVLKNIMLKFKGVKAKEAELKEQLFGGKIPKTDNDSESDGFQIDCALLIKLISGGTVKLSALFCKESYQELEKDSVCIASADFDERIPELSVQLDDGHCDLLIAVKNIYDWSLLMGMLDSDQNGKTCTVSGSKVKIYEEHEKDLKALKHICRTYLKSHYSIIFRDESVPNNYVWYSYHFKGKMPASGKRASQEDFCKFIESYLKSVQPNKEDAEMFERIKTKALARTLCPKQVTTDNRVIPYQLNYRELKCILENAVKYIPLLNQTDGYGSIADKILSIMKFRIPYYVGPLVSEKKSDHAWMVRKAEGKIYPWNFNQMVDHEQSEECFIRRMTCTCMYLAGEDVLPKNSLLYSKFCVLNEINPIVIDGQPISVETKQMIYQELFVNAKKRVTKKAIVSFLIKKGKMTEGQNLSGVDDILKSTLKPYHDFCRLLSDGVLTENDAESIIERITVTTDKKRLKKWMKAEYDQLSDANIQYLSNLNYQDYGRLSRKFFEGIYDIDSATGELRTERNIITALWDTNENLMQLLSDKHGYSKMIGTENQRYYEEKPKSIEQKMDALYLPKPVRRAVTRTLDIMKELRSLLPEKPDRIFIEMARGGEPNKKGKRTKSRKEQITEWLTAMRADLSKSEYNELTSQLNSLEDNRLRSDKYYLYFMQLGKCMYSGDPIALERISEDYNIDHIYPQSKTMDDSLDNQVLVRSELNGQKGDTYPIDDAIRRKMYVFWESLRKKNLISQKKYERLTRATVLTDEELSGFIQRQLVETRQSTKAIASLLTDLLPDTEIVYVKAGLVSQFRHDLDLLKCREINDLHHAKDAYLNIVIGNVYHERFTRKFFERIGTEKYSLRLFEQQGDGKARGLLTRPVKNAWNPDASFEIVRKMMAKNSVRYVRYCYRRKGGLFHQQPKRKSEGLIPRKQYLDASKYGGYSAASSSFFTLVKYADTICLLSVPVLYADRFENSLSFAQEYALSQYSGRTKLQTDDIQFPLSRRIIKINTMLELDSVRINLTAEDGIYFLYSPAMPLVLSADMERYIKRLASFMEKRKNNTNYTITPWDQITAEENISLYDTLTTKMLNKTYQKLHERTGMKLRDGRGAFIKLDLLEQVSLLLQAVSVLKTGRRNDVDLSLIGGSKRDDKRRLNMRLQSIHDCQSIYIIDQSPTGLIEHRSENLLTL